MSSPTRRKTRNMGKNSNNPNIKEEDNKKIKAKQQRSRQEENRSNLEKARLILNVRNTHSMKYKIRYELHI
jgi:hypothetical protein